MKKKLLIAGAILISCGTFAQSEKKVQDIKSDAKPLENVTFAPATVTEISGDQIVPAGKPSTTKAGSRVIRQSEAMTTVDGSKIVPAKEQLSKPSEIRKQ